MPVGSGSGQAHLSGYGLAPVRSAGPADSIPSPVDRCRLAVAATLLLLVGWPPDPHRPPTGGLPASDHHLRRRIEARGARARLTPVARAAAAARARPGLGRRRRCGAVLRPPAAATEPDRGDPLATGRLGRSGDACQATLVARRPRFAFGAWQASSRAPSSPPAAPALLIDPVPASSAGRALPRLGPVVHPLVRHPRDAEGVADRSRRVLPRLCRGGGRHRVGGP